MSDTPMPSPATPEKKIVDPVQRSIAKPSAFAKPGTLTKPKAKGQGMRMRPLSVKRQPGRQRKKDDPRFVHYF